MASLRDGDPQAYEVLWARHVASARRVAAQLAPLQAEDLVSETFLAVYDQVLVQGKGPTSAFRPYLFAVMRNTAARWHREGTRVIYDPAADVAMMEDGWTSIESQYESALLLDAFHALPTRWQRVLWLAEVESVGRPAIAAELGIGPNAVSALYRRARSGLRVEWLRAQIPVELRDDPDHAAAALPAVIAKKDSAARRHIAAH